MSARTTPTSIPRWHDECTSSANPDGCSNGQGTLRKVTRVLLVDDSQEILAHAREALVHACEIVGAVTDGPSALTAARRLQPDVVVLDISMPGMSGLDVACALRAEASTVAIVFLTVHDDAQFVDAAMKAGGIGYVVKLRLAHDLLHAVQEAKAGRSFISPRA